MANSPVTIITPWAVGGLADQINRAMSEYGKEQYGQPLLADNILGSGGAVALTEYTKEKPNTHKLILGGEGSFAIAPLTMKVAYKFEDFVPVINIYSSTFVLVTNPRTKVDSIPSLKEYIAKGKKSKLRPTVQTPLKHYNLPLYSMKWGQNTKSFLMTVRMKP